ncbi:translation initiation factor IF-3 [Candidatus Woesebacteria bacterium]|nr:translation initiation factor IF-3 [Candidatus Woesebacteria bacterium]
MNNRNRRYKPYQKRKYYYLNYKIEAQELRVITASGEQVGVLSKDDAIRKAKEEGLDLVLIAPAAKPPVAKIIDFKKFLYLENKKDKEAKKGSKKSGTKDVNFSLFTAEADLQRFVNRSIEFLEKGNQVRINLKLKGREMTKKPMALKAVAEFIGKLGEVNVAKEPRIEGRIVRAVVSKKK